MADAVGRIDELVTEYLLYRGFHSAAKLLEADSKNARDKGLRVDKILDQLHVYITTSDLQGLIDYWHFLDRHLFSHLAPPHEGAVHKLETNLFKTYVISAVQSNKQDKVSEFFEKMAPQLQGQSGWSEWFVLPFLKNPEEHRPFTMYFSKQWQDTFFLSLHNFMSIVVQHMPLPGLLNHGELQQKITRLREENARYKQQLASISDCKPIPTHSTSHDIPSSAPPCGTGLELMDDFFVISQESQPSQQTTKSQSQPKSQQLKTFIRNIAIPPSPILGKKPVVMTTAASSVHTAPKKKEESSTAAVRKACKNIPAGDRVMDTGATGGCLHDDASVRVKCDATLTASPRHVPQTRNKDSKSTDLWHSSNSISQSERRSTSAQQPGQSSPRSGRAYSTTDVPCRNAGMPAPFLLLSQEEYVEHHSCVTQCQFCSDGHTVATLDTDGVIKVWSLQPGPVTLVTTMSKTQLISQEWLKCSGRRLLLGSKSCSIRLFDVHEKKTVVEVTTNPQYPRITHLASDLTGTRFVSSAMGSRLGTASNVGASVPQRSLCAGKLTLWDAETMSVEHHLGTQDVAVNSTSFSEDGRLLLAGTVDGIIRLYDTRRHECVTAWQAHVGDIYTICFSCHGNSCYSMGSDGQFVEWSLGGSRIADNAIHPGACGPFVLSGTGGYRQVQTPKGQLFAFSADGQHVLTCAQNGGSIYQFQKQSLCRVLNLGGHSCPVTCVDWTMSSDYNMCVTGSMDGKVMLSTLLAQ